MYDFNAQKKKKKNFNFQKEREKKEVRITDRANKSAQFHRRYTIPFQSIPILP